MKPHQRQSHPSGSRAPAQDEFIFFYFPNAPYGEFCPWYFGPFTVSQAEIASLIGQPCELSGANETITFNCAEQFMMYCKAGRFRDFVRQLRIMATASPKEQKRLGKNTIGCCDRQWDDVKSKVVVAGNVAKFGQNEGLKAKLLATGDRVLVEASSKDRVWGIGFKEKHAMGHRAEWGENRLGEALMVVRERLRREEEAQIRERAEKEPWTIYNNA
ncbi:uncharacterized protein J7T54_007268 [Emericellopsis cladophorae]|uniref:NADAR domain-containing protein n=1 Tax=Emericellopsis cladophorae TaxID=2686198 RepID=A0A9P9XZY8_9HYPO|nr:uncharacterized protein J7T54_007268 [Emericellopsis cladophorae]KAI6780419.1 hypothetical protein J7T54_007268 [Emericellopsis cladophorae]